MAIWWTILAVCAALAAAAAFTTGQRIGGRRSRAATLQARQETGADAICAAFMIAPAGQVVVDTTGTVIVANETARELGVMRDGALDDAVAERAAECAARPRRGESDEWEASRDRGRPELLHLSANPIGGGLALVTVTDETASRQAENMRRDFVANVSHELKSPVTAIGLLAEAVDEAADNPDTVRDFTSRMQKEASRLGALISELIALSAIQDGDLHDVDLVQIDAIVADTVDRASVSAAASNITIDTDIASGALVLGDRSLLTTAIGNLIDNAVHYSESGGAVTITRTTRRGYVDIAVADHGIGISPPDQRRVFERFFRADPARSRSTGGTGLGLSIVKHVAANHGGSIRLASRLGVGSTFTLRLPLAKPEAPGAGRNDAEPAAPCGAPTIAASLSARKAH